MIYHGDCLEVLRGMADNSLDACVTDPPYGLSFMGKGWDYDVPSVDIWREVFRVLKPGAHLLAFAGTRTQHRMAVNIEDAGFEIRDMIAWVYGSGFPKSLDVSKAIDKAAGAERQIVGPNRWDGRRTEGSGPESGDNCYGQYGVPSGETAPATEAARQWQGWGTALKPALEPITVARKPLIGTVAANVQAHGTGALNIDGCRVGAEIVGWGGGRGGSDDPTQSKGRNYRLAEGAARPVEGRWPANLIHDGSEEVLAGFPETKSGAGNKNTGNRDNGNTIGNGLGRGNGFGIGGDSGSAARFFKTCKWSDDDWHHQSNSAQPVNAAESPSPACETHFAPDPAETRNSDFRSEASPVIPASTGNCNGSTRTPNHAPGAETPGNTDTIPTMTSPSSSSGCAPHAIDANTNSGSAARVEGVNVQVRGMRFVYNAKASKADRDEGNNHPTVKPTDLMRYLCRLVTPPGGTVLDPFMGSGSTGKAATLEGFAFVGIEREAEYLEIAKARIEHVKAKPRQEALL